MAKGSIFLGQSKGKIGTVVTWVQGGEQRTRVYTDAGARKGDAASLPARQQRVAFGGAASEWRMYSWVCTRMFRRGKKTNESDYNFFVRRNFENLPFFSKDMNLFGAQSFMPGVFSTGSYGKITQSIEPETFVEAGTTYYLRNEGQGAIEETVKYTDTVGKWKTELKKAFPKASKITFALSFGKIDTDMIEELGGITTSYRWKALVLNLEGENRRGENEENIKEFMRKEGVEDAGIDVDAQADLVVSQGRNLLCVFWNNEFSSYGEGLMMLMFATNDNANDCYTTELLPKYASVNYSPLRWWLSLKTLAQMNIASRSYGYTQNVMQTEIVEVGNKVMEIIDADADEELGDEEIDEGTRKRIKEEYRKQVLAGINADIKQIAENCKKNEEIIAKMEEEKETKKAAVKKNKEA